MVSVVTAVCENMASYTKSGKKTYRISDYRPRRTEPQPQLTVTVENFVKFRHVVFLRLREWCGQRVCLSVRSLISKTTRPNFMEFSVRVTCGHRLTSYSDINAIFHVLPLFLDVYVYRPTCHPSRWRMHSSAVDGVVALHTAGLRNVRGGRVYSPPRGVTSRTVRYKQT